MLPSYASPPFRNLPNSINIIIIKLCHHYDHQKNININFAVDIDIAADDGA